MPLSWTIVCRGSTAQGLGHLFRTRTFARALHDRGRAVEVVAIIEPGLEGILADLPCAVRGVRDDGEVAGLLAARGPDVCVLDTTRLDPAVLRRVRESAGLVASLSPVFAQAAEIDLLFSRSKRAAAPPGVGVTVVGGLEYAVFGEHCRVIGDDAFERGLAASSRPVAVSMGGSDAANKTLRVLAALGAVEEDLTIWVLLGEGYAHSYDALVRAGRGQRRHEVVLAKTSRSMWEVMDRCVLAVLAGGLTTVEAVYAGLPSINVFESQAAVDATAQELFELGVCVDGGLFSEAALPRLVEGVCALLRDPEGLRQMRARTKGLLDRRGAERVIAVIEHEHARRGAARQARRASRPEATHAGR
jgi:spore coat polysaccharide biosynthesis predicted glycosyltransferase SpsG